MLKYKKNNVGIDDGVGSTCQISIQQKPPTALQYSPTELLVVL